MRSAMRVAAALVIVLPAIGCMKASTRSAPVLSPVTLDIHNLAFADVDVYVVTSPGIASASRLITVTGFSKATVSVSVNHLQPGGILQLEMHAIGSRTQWLSPSLSVSPGEHVMLEVNVDAAGNMSHTLLYPAPDSSGVSAAPSSPRSHFSILRTRVSPR